MEDIFKINTPEIDTEAIMANIRQRVEEKRHTGVYDRYNLSAIKAIEMDNLKSDEAYLDYYLRTIWRAADIDLGDFPIPCKTPVIGKPVVMLKKIIWQLLKFYTFRLFSQQKDFNAKIVSIVEGLNRKMDRRTAVLEDRIENLRSELEKGTRAGDKSRGGDESSR